LTLKMLAVDAPKRGGPAAVAQFALVSLRWKTLHRVERLRNLACAGTTTQKKRSRARTGVRTT
jgi:hypothetical protein